VHLVVASLLQQYHVMQGAEIITLVVTAIHSARHDVLHQLRCDVLTLRMSGASDTAVVNSALLFLDAATGEPDGDTM